MTLTSETYTLDESPGTIAVTLQGSISEKSIGSTFTRHVQIAGNQLTIWLPTCSQMAQAVDSNLNFLATELKLLPRHGWMLS